MVQRDENGKALYGATCEENVYNCSNFKTQPEAQEVYDTCTTQPRIVIVTASIAMATGSRAKVYQPADINNTGTGPKLTSKLTAVAKNHPQKWWYFWYTRERYCYSIIIHMTTTVSLKTAVIGTLMLALMVPAMSFAATPTVADLTNTVSDTHESFEQLKSERRGR
jgi:hypothetical protein